jgi:hypothetical protein
MDTKSRRRKKSNKKTPPAAQKPDLTDEYKQPQFLSMNPTFNNTLTINSSVNYIESAQFPDNVSYLIVPKDYLPLNQRIVLHWPIELTITDIEEDREFVHKLLSSENFRRGLIRSLTRNVTVAINDEIIAQPHPRLINLYTPNESFELNNNKDQCEIKHVLVDPDGTSLTLQFSCMDVLCANPFISTYNSSIYGAQQVEIIVNIEPNFPELTERGCKVTGRFLYGPELYYSQTPFDEDNNTNGSPIYYYLETLYFGETTNEIIFPDSKEPQYLCLFSTTTLPEKLQIDYNGTPNIANTSQHELLFITKCNLININGRVITHPDEPNFYCLQLGVDLHTNNMTKGNNRINIHTFSYSGVLTTMLVIHSTKSIKKKCVTK